MACILGHHQTHGVLRDRFPNPGHHSDRHARMPRRDIAYLVVTVHYCVEEHSPDTDCVVLIDRVLQNLGLTLAPENDNFIKNNNFWLAVLAFIIYTSAFVAESLRAGINTVPFGQAEAGRSLGLSFGQNFSAIVFPQAFRASIVPLGNTLIALSKNTTVASVIGVGEASLLMKSTIENHADQLFLVFGIFALGFIILTLPMGLFFGWAGKRLAVKR